MHVRVFILILLYCVLQCFADSCALPDALDTFHSTMSVLLAYPAGIGPGAAFGITAINAIYEKWFKPETEDPLMQLTNDFDKKISGAIEESVLNQFNGDLNGIKAWMKRYENVYGNWSLNKELYKQDIIDFYRINLPIIRKDIERIKGDATKKIHYLSLPMIVTMSEVHLAMLYDAAVIGNDQLGISTENNLTNFRHIFNVYLNDYISFIFTTYNSKHSELRAKAEDGSEDSFNKLITFEKMSTLNFFDIMAKWTMFIPNTPNIIPLDIFYTHPIYSNISLCRNNDCSIDVNAFDENRKEYQYQGLLEKINYETHGFSGNGPVTDATYFTKISTIYGKDNNKGITDIMFSYAMAGYDFWIYYNNKGQCTTRYWNDKCSWYVLSKIANIGNTANCAFQRRIKAPENHAISRFIAAQKTPGFRWITEYRKYKQRVDFTGITTPHAIRFPGDYILYKTKGNANIGSLNYLLGGYDITIIGTLLFNLPSVNKGFDLGVRIYSKQEVNVPECVLIKRDIPFVENHIYDGYCSSNTLTLSGSIGAVEVVQLERCKEGEYRDGHVCKNIFCMDNKECRSSQLCQNLAIINKKLTPDPRIKICIEPKPVPCNPENCGHFCEQASNIYSRKISLQPQCETDGCQCHFPTKLNDIPTTVVDTVGG